MHMIWHDDPSAKLVTLTIEEFQCRADYICAVCVAQVTLSIASVEVAVDAIRIPAKQFLLFVPGKRAPGCKRLINDRLALLLKAEKDFTGQTVCLTEGNEVGAALTFHVRKH